MTINLPLDNPLFLIPLMSGLLFCIAGYVMLKFPPKKINSLYGYRTTSSMKSKDRWDFSQKYSAIEMMKAGGILAVCSGIGLLYQPADLTSMFLGLGLMILAVALLVIRIEKAIHKKFKICIVFGASERKTLGY